MVHPVIIPTSILCQPHVTASEETHPEVVLIVSDEILGSAGYMMFCQCDLDQLVWFGSHNKANELTLKLNYLKTHPYLTDTILFRFDIMQKVYNIFLSIA